VTPLTVSKVKSSFFENKDVFPDGAITFDNALLMRNIDHEWRSEKSLENKNTVPNTVFMPAAGDTL
jgi:hypothetical protein